MMNVPLRTTFSENSSKRRPAQEAHDLSVLCGMPSVRFTFEHDLSVRGFRVDTEAHMKLLLDVPRAYAMRTLEGMDRTGSKVIVVTWNSCPEHVEDLRELQPNALLSDEFFLRQDLNVALGEVLDRVSDGEYYSFTPGPTTVLTPTERAVLRYAARGWSNRCIGERLCVREQTVKNRLRSTYRKLNIANHAQAVLYYWQLWQPPE